MEAPAYLNLDVQTIPDQHICCAFSDKKCRGGYQGKKDWLASQFQDGYVFRKLDVRGKVFIEYVPAEKAWVPVEAQGYMMINCFWVSGKFKGHGHAKDLLQACEDDAATMNGVVVVTGNKKQPFMSDPKFFQKQGYEVCDTAEPYFQLRVKKFSADAPDPSFLPQARHGKCDIEHGLAVFYTPACPFNDYYVNQELVSVAKQKEIPITVVPLDTREKARNHTVPHTLYSVFYNGEFVTQHILNEKVFGKFFPE